MFDMSFSSTSFNQQLRIKIVGGKKHLYEKVTCSMSERFGDMLTLIHKIKISILTCFAFPTQNVM